VHPQNLFSPFSNPLNPFPFKIVDYRGRRRIGIKGQKISPSSLQRREKKGGLLEKILFPFFYPGGRAVWSLSFFIPLL
jgi:hypothetical protein